MTEWFTAQDLAGVLKISDRGVRKKASTEGWVSRSKATGKGQEYHLSSLPDAAKTKLISNSVKESTAGAKGIKLAKKEKLNHQTVNKQNALLDYNKLTLRQKLIVDCKLDIINAIANTDLSIEKFIDSYNDKHISISDLASQNFPTLRKTTVYEWRSRYKKLGIIGLAGKRGTHRKATGVIDTNQDFQNFIIGMLVEYPHISNTVLYKAIKTEFNQLLNLPSLRTVERWVAKWKNENKQVFCAITSPDDWKNQYMAAFGSGNEHVTELNQLWEFDSTPADLMLTDGRYTIIGVIDVYTRRIKFVVSRSSNSEGVSQVIRRAILDWGIPQVAKTDNGQDYISDRTKAAFHGLDIEIDVSQPFSPWEKSHIERVFRSFSHDIFELLPGFIGHNVADRKKIESRKQFSDRLFKKDEMIEITMSSDELQAFCDNWIDNEYHIRVHSTLKKSPMEMVRDWEGNIYRVENERALDILLSEPAGTRIVGKKGIKLDGGIYIHPELGVIVGNEVHVYYDEHDMGCIYVYDMNNEFVCIAEDPIVTGVSRKEVAAKTKEVQREAVQEEKRRLKAAAKPISKRDIAQEILTYQAQQNLEQNTVAFPRPSQAHTSERLTAATEALIAKNGIKESGLTDEQQTEVQGIQKQIKAQVIQPTFNRKPTLPTDPAEKYNLWLSLDKKAKADLEISSEYKGFYESFPKSAEFSSGKMLAELRKQTASK
ncbi:Mu transposase C-terminal domain-containing protein [Pseudomonas sp. HK3]